MNIMNLLNKKLVVGFSGGKDSTATILFLKKLGYKFDTFFCDTGWEHEETYRYIDYINKILLDNKLITIKPELNFTDLVKKKKMWPSRRIRFCTQHLKIYPIQKYFNLPDYNIVNVSGERALESPARAKKEEFEKDNFFGCYMWRPIKHFTDQDVFNIHKEFKIKPNPLYLKGHKRVGCYPCIFANKQQIISLKYDNIKIAEIRALEKELNKPFMILRRANRDILGIDDLLLWAGSQQDFLFPEIEAACSSYYKLCE